MTTYGRKYKPRNPCWGYGSSDHRFANCKAVTCPHKDKPVVMERAAKKACKGFIERLAAKKKQIRQF
jgi:hypothetical protein